MSVELKPCPFCGGKAKVKVRRYPINDVYVACENCSAATRSVDISEKYCAEEKAAEKWNMRAGDDDE